MKFIEEEKQGDPVTEIVAPLLKQGKQKVGQIRLHPGHKLWEWNYEKGLLVEVTPEYKAQLTKTSLNDPQKVGMRGRITGNKNCIYFSKLNYANAYAYVLKLIKTGTEKRPPIQ